MSDQAQDFIIDDVDLSNPNLTGWDGQSGPILPPGEYEVEVADAIVEPTKDGKGRNVKLIHRVRTEGDHYDAEIWQWLKIPGAGDKQGVARRMAHVIRDVLGCPLLPGGGFETKHLRGRRMLITVVHDESVTYDSVNNTETKKVRTQIQGERALAVTEAPAPVAPPPAARPTNAAPAQQRRPAAAAPAPGKR